MLITHKFFLNRKHEIFTYFQQIFYGGTLLSSELHLSAELKRNNISVEKIQMLIHRDTGILCVTT